MLYLSGRQAWASICLPIAFMLGTQTALAACDTDYTVQAGDTYYSISQLHYGTRREWQTLFQANQSASGQPSLLPGNTLYIPCIAGSSLPVTDVKPTVAPSVVTPAPSGTTQQDARQAIVAAPAKPEPIPVRVYPANAELKLLTGGNYEPFTGHNLPSQGLATELVHALLDISPSPLTYSITWEDDWSKHLFPMIDDKEFDMGFPWLRPDCEATPDNDRCENFLFSEPLMLMPIMLFVREDNQFRFEDDGDLIGRSICRPAGYFTHDLDRSDRRWITEGTIDFVAGENPKDCFNRVLSGEVDAASFNLFLGASVILDMGLRSRIVPLERPVSEEGLHVVISKGHWRATALLYRINAGLQRLKADGAYQEIVSRHLEVFQSKLQ